MGVIAGPGGQGLVWQQQSASAAPGSDNWLVNIEPPTAVDPNSNPPPLCSVSCQGQRGQSVLTAAGIVAMVGELSAYLTATNVAAILSAAGTVSPSVGCRLSGAGLTVSMLPANAVTVANAIAVILGTTGNTT